MSVLRYILKDHKTELRRKSKDAPTVEMARYTTLLVALLTSSFVEGFITAYPSINTKTTVSCGLVAKIILRFDSVSFC